MKKIILLLTIILVTGSSVLAQAPVINSFSPDTGLVGSTVSISGAFFDPIPANNQVFFGSAEATVLTASFSTLTVAVPAGTTTNLISVRNISTKLIGYSNNHFNGVFCDTPLDATTYNTYNQELGGIYGAYNIDIYDMDGDGKSDIITGRNNGGLTIALNNSTVGTMNFVANNIATTAVQQFFVADFDGDGKRDIVISGYQGAYLYRNLSSPGNISFGSAFTLSTYGYYQCAAGDIDNDGKVDFVGGNGNTIRTFRNTSSGPGNFSFTENTLRDVGSGSNGIQVLDIDGDGKSDIVGTQRGAHRIYALRNTTSSTTFSFASTQFFSTVSTGPYRLKFGDFDKDGKIDLVMPLYEGAKTCIFRNTSSTGSINFETPLLLGASANNYRVGVGDVNGDGLPDIVTKPNGIGTIFQVYENTSSGAGNVAFNSAITYYSSGAAEVGGIAIGDMDGDLVPDIATSGISSNTIRFHRNTSAQVDNDAPTAICKNIIVALNPNGTVTITPQMLDNGSSDACGVDYLQLNSPGSTELMDSLDFTCAQIGDNAVTLTVFDFSGNSSTCEAIVNIAPAAIIVAGQTTVCQGDTVLLTANLGDSYQWQKDGIEISGATDQTYIADVSGGYTVSVTNAGGCSGTSVSTVVTISEVTQATTTLSDSPDLCQGNTLTITSSEGSAYVWSTGENSQSITVDTAGNYSVTVYDENGCTSESEPVVVTVTPLPVASITASGATTFCSGDSVTLTANEAASYLWSTQETTQSIEVTQRGNYSVKVYNAEGCFETSTETVVRVNQTPSVTTSEAVTICDTPAVLSAVGNPNGAPIDSQLTQYVLYDAPGGANGTFTNNLCNDGYQFFRDISFTDNITETNISGLNFKLYYTCSVVTFTFKINGNVLGNYTQVDGQPCLCDPSPFGTYPKTVSFTEAQVAAFWNAGPNSITVEMNSTGTPYRQGTALSGIVAEVSSPGETYSWSPATGLSDANSATPEALPTETTTYTVTYSTGNGCSVTSDVVVTVQCNEPPVAVCKDIEVSADNNCEGTAVAAVFNNGSSDPDGDEITLSISPEGPYELGDTVVTLTVMDPSGETDSCTATITVTDYEAPVLNAPADASYQCKQDVPAAGMLAWTDNCDGSGEVQGTDSSSGTCPMTITRTWSYTDIAGNLASVSQTITVNDTEPPVLTAPADVSYQCIQNVPEAGMLAWTDNCDGSGEVQGTDSSSGTCPMTIIRTWSYTDGCDNTTSVSQTITVNDTEPPVLTPPGPETYQCIDDVPAAGMLGWTDNCDGSGEVQGTDSSDGQTCPETITRTWSYTDACDNTTSVSQTITVDDTVVPELSAIRAPAGPVELLTGFVLEADYSDCNVVTATWSVTSNAVDYIDYPGIVVDGTISLSSGDAATSFAETGVFRIVLEVVDDCGNINTVDYDYVVIYDPSGGFVTGGGWIDSPAGALVGTDYKGKANFGLVAKYKTGNNNVTLEGNTNFQFKEGDFHFKSNDYSAMSLVISGERKATYKGSGTVNGSGNFDFRVIVIDGEAPGAGPDDEDSFRIKVWTSGDPDDVVYDNEIGVAENADSSTELGGGQIVIHKPKGNNKASAAESTAKPTAEDVFDGFELVSWPNPTKEYFNILLKSKNNVDQISIQVFDLNGRVVSSKTGEPNKEHRIGTSFQAGLYFINVTQGSESKQIKLIKY